MNDLKTDVLDHGFVTLRNLAGPTRRAYNHSTPSGLAGAVVSTRRMFDADDRDPPQAARMSFDDFEAERTEAQDHKLAGYLMKNWHTSPFEMVECWFEMKMPIFVARQFVRHRTAMLNEVSGRYVTLPAEWYIPEIVGGKAPSAKQGQADNLSPATQKAFKDILNRKCGESYHEYVTAMHHGVAAEHARMLLHLNHYTHWLWKQNLHNMLNFLRLRDHFHAQIEAQSYAKAVDGHLRTYLPKSMELYDEHRRMREPADLDALLAEFYDPDLEHKNGLLEEIKIKLREAGL
jgi:thymidylate synthase (FAD)